MKKIWTVCNGCAHGDECSRSDWEDAERRRYCENWEDEDEIPYDAYDEWKIEQEDRRLRNEK